MTYRERRRMTRSTLIVGAGEAGVLLVRDLRASGQGRFECIGFVDDDRGKHGVLVEGLPVFGPADDIPALVHRYRIDEVFIAIPSAPAPVIRRLVALCRASGVPCLTTPSVSDLSECRVSLKQMRGVRIEDLLGRAPVVFDAAGIRQTLQGRCVLVTGAGGSIGSEIARQVAAASPSALVLVDRAESDLYDIECDIRRAHPALALEAAVTDILDAPDVDAVFAAHRPARVYHAAAYKHVPLMERHAVAAARNNVIGTAVVAEAALKYGAERFVLLSSDKAVRPTSLMGATKRAAERVVLALTGGATLFTAVRFGNVLASHGSVVPLFQKQIAAGGPVTVTDPEVVRYFMTVQEAVHLVLRASIDGAGGEIFHLDMGESIRIVDLAEQLIRLSGLEPGIDIEIAYTGMRPGEKLLEELLVEGDTVESTRHPKIFTLRERLLPLSREWLADLAAAVASRDAERVIALLRLAAPEYAPGHGASGPR